MGPTAAPPAVAEAVRQAFAEHSGRLVALLTRQFRNFDIAEESVADAYLLALRRWSADGVPKRPAAWLYTAAKRRATDRIRRVAMFDRKLPLLIVDAEATAVDTIPQTGEIADERLRLIATCCHPALAVEARIALTLRLVGGLTTAEIASAFVVGEATMAARITRAKKKIAAAGIPYRVPAADELPERVDGILTVLYLIFTEGHSATTGEAPVRASLCGEAIRLTRVLIDLLGDGHPNAEALLALLLFQHSRRDARVAEDGSLVLLADQDRTRWHREEIVEALGFLSTAAEAGAESSYLLQAAIAGHHATAPRAEDTDWERIAALYERLEALTGSPVVRLNRAVAVAETAGPASALDLLEGLDARLGGYRMLPAARADLLRRCRRWDEARREYARALELAGNETERAFLRGRLAELERFTR